MSADTIPADTVPADSAPVVDAPTTTLHPTCADGLWLSSYDPDAVCVADDPCTGLTTLWTAQPCAALPDDCIGVDPVTLIGSTRWSLLPCTFDIGTPATSVAVERTTHTLPVTGMEGSTAIAASAMLLAGLACVALVRVTRGKR
jgi:hypothetical protein